jgi:SPP1 family predicted phage head-tail adaptor
MGALSSRRQVKANASSLYRYGHVQHLTGTPNGQGGLIGGGTWTDVPDLAHVAFAYRTWNLYEQFIAQQSYPGVNARIYIRYRKSVNINSTMRFAYGTKVYYIRGVDNYDQANDALLLYLEELQATGGTHT